MTLNQGYKSHQGTLGLLKSQIPGQANVVKDLFENAVFLFILDKNFQVWGSMNTRALVMTPSSPEKGCSIAHTPSRSFDSGSFYIS